MNVLQLMRGCHGIPACDVGRRKSDIALKYTGAVTRDTLVCSTDRFATLETAANMLL